MARREIHVCFAIELNQLLKHHRAGGHSNGQGKGFGSEYGAHQTADEEIFYDVAKRREHPCVVGGKTARKRLAPPTEIQDLQVLLWDAFDAGIDDGLDLFCFLLRRQHHPAAQALIEGAIATGAGKNKGNRGQHILRLQHLEHLRAP